MSLRKKILIGVASVLLGVWMLLGYIGACIATMSYPRDIPDRADIDGFPVVDVRLLTEDGVHVAASYARSGTNRAVVFMPGITSDRRQGMGRASHYLKLGYSVLLVDPRGTGESDKAIVTVGWNERKDLAAGCAYLRELGYKHIGVHGISMGAASIAYSFQDDPEYLFVVLESCYDTLDNAWRNRLKMFHVPHVITWPMRWCTEWRMGVRAKRLQPVDFMPQCTVPTLVMAGDSEPELKTEETRAVFEACGARVKQLKLFADVGHVSFLRTHPEEFKELFYEFIQMVTATLDKSAAKAA